MTSSKNTKRALLASVLSVVLCCAMLVGSTFAWFTDSVTNTDNRIVAGNLDIDLLMDKQDGNGYVSIADSEGDIFDEAEIAQNSNKTLWEPGKTQIVYLGVQNKGSLALKYNILLDVTDNGLVGALEYAVLDGAQASDLADVTDWEALKAMEGAQTGDIAAGRTIAAPNGCLDEIANGTKGETDYFALAVHMKEDAGNEYQGKDITIDVTVVATQATAEEDGFGNDQYDADAEYPVVATDTDALTEIIQNASADEPVTVFLSAAGTYDLADGVAKGKDITIVGTKDTVVDICQDLGGESGNSGMNYQDGARLTFKGVTVKGQNSGNFGGIVRAQVTFEDCVIQDTFTLYGDAVFKNCTLVSSTDRYNVWTWGASRVEFTDCTFNTAGKAILVYGGAGEHTDVIVSGCTFNDSSNGSGSKAAIETGDDYGAAYNITINNTVVNDFAVNAQSNSKIWGNKNNMSKEVLNVVIDGVDVY